MEAAGSVGLSVLGPDLRWDGNTGGERNLEMERGVVGPERGQDSEVRGKGEVGDLEIDWR